MMENNMLGDGGVVIMTGLFLISMTFLIFRISQVKRLKEENKDLRNLRKRDGWMK